MSEYPKSVWDLLERIEPAGLHGLPIEDLPADVLRAAELAGLVRVFNEWPGPKVVYVVSADAPRDRSHIPPRPMPDPVKVAGLTPAGLEALTARRCDEALAALGGQKLTSAVEPTAEQARDDRLAASIAERIAASLPTKAAPVAGETVSAHKAQQRAEKEIKARGWPGSKNKLARICECSYSTIRKAIEASPYLREAEAKYNLKNPKPTIEKNTPEHIAMVDETMRQLAESLPPSQRAAVNEPGFRERLMGMTLDELTAVANTADERLRASARER